MGKKLDTIIVSTRPEGVSFFTKKCYWENIRIKKEKLQDLKYIAFYQSTTEKKIKRLGEITKIEEYSVSPIKPHRYRIFFKLLEKKINVISDDSKNRRLVIQAPRYTNYNYLIECKTLSELFQE